MSDLQISIKKIETNTADGQPILEVWCEFISPIAYGIQPSWAYFVERDNMSLKVGDVIKADSLFMLYNDPFDPWEILGSDHNDVFLYYGKKEGVDAIIEQVNTYNKNLLTGFDKHDFDENPLNMLYWNLDNGMSVLFYYAQDFNGDILFKHPDVLCVTGGGAIDDLLAHEVMFPLVHKLVKKIKSPTIEEDIDELEDYLENYEGYENCVQVNGKKYKNQSDLLIGLAQFIYVDLLQFNLPSEDPEDDENLIFNSLAKKIKIYQQIHSLVAPTNTEKTKLIFQHENSNKQYDVIFQKNDNTYEVHVSYGGIGKKQTPEIKYQGEDLSKAQQIYIDIIADKMSKGYANLV